MEGNGKRRANGARRTRVTLATVEVYSDADGQVRARLQRARLVDERLGAVSWALATLSNDLGRRAPGKASPSAEKASSGAGSDDGDGGYCTGCGLATEAHESCGVRGCGCPCNYPYGRQAGRGVVLP